MSQIIKIDDFNFQVGEPRISSELLARKLGYENRQGLERLAKRHRVPLMKLGDSLELSVPVKASKVPRSCRIKLFNRDQALYLVAKSEKPVANELTIQLVQAWRQLEDTLGLLKPISFELSVPVGHYHSGMALVGWRNHSKELNQDVESLKQRVQHANSLLMQTAPANAGVYCLLMPDGTIKIGNSINVRERMKGYLTHQAEAPQYLATLPGTETDHHRALAEWRVTGEFFANCPPVRSYLNKILGVQ